MVMLLAGCNQDVQVTRNPPPAVARPVPPPPPPPPDTTATLSWMAPTTDTNGDPVVLTGFRIYYGTASGNYTTTINVDVGQQVYVIDNLPQHFTYYFAITALNAIGESDKSAEVSKAIQ